MRPIVAKDLMTPNVLTARADMTVSELAAFLTDNEITGAPVEDDDGKVVGVVSAVDIAKTNSEKADSTAWDAAGVDSYREDWERRLGDGIHIIHLGDDRALVRDIMNPNVHAVRLDADVAEIVDKMLRYHLHRVLVLESDHLVGIVTTSDLLGLLVKEHEYA